MKIVPAILTNNREQFLRMLNLSKEFADYIQIDIMDGEFVPSKSVTAKDIEDVSTPLRSEVHLMVKNPKTWLASLRRFGAERIIYHYEIDRDHKEIISQIKEYKFKVGLAINPSTSIEDFRYLIKDVEVILFMSVEPGFYGNKFIPQVLDKIRKFRRLFPEKQIGIDGGIKYDNIKVVAKLGLDYACVGSAIFGALNPAQAYFKFKEIIAK
jgi:ribulose-phosphate 3-epimerase